MRLLPDSATRDASLLLWSRGLRAFGDGLVSIVLPAYLLLRGFDAFEVGAAGDRHDARLGAASTLLVGMLAGRFARKRLLLLRCRC